MAKKVQFTTNQPSATTDYLAADNTWKTIPGGGGGGSGIPHGTTSGTDTYTTTISGVTAYNDADAFLIRFAIGNTTSATLNINSLGAIPLYRNNDGELIGGDIIAGAEMLCVYNSSTNRFQVIGTAPNTLLAYVTNVNGSTITKGQPVYAFGGQGDRLTVKLASNNVDATSAQTVGMVLSTSIANNQKGLIIVNGQLDGLNIFPTATWSDGDAVYLGATAGSITNVKPFAPNHLVYLGFVTTASNGSAGRMYVRVQNGYEMQELHNVSAQSPANNDILKYNTTTSLWEKSNALSTKQDTITGAATTVTTTDLTGSRVLVSNPGGKIAVSAVTTTEVGYLVGVTSDIQTQLNGKQGTLTLTTTGTSGAATLGSGILNIPQYASAGSGASFLAGNVGNGNTSVGAGVTQYLNVQGAALVIAESIRVLMMPQDCTLSRLHFHTGTTQPGSGTLVITLRKNLVDTALVITIAAGAAANFYSNLVNSVAFSSGDRCSVKVVNNASAASASVVGISVMVSI
jgi:hypothetical protein